MDYSVRYIAPPHSVLAKLLRRLLSELQTPLCAFLVCVLLVPRLPSPRSLFSVLLWKRPHPPILESRLNL